MASFDADVLVIGGGPVGTTALSLLDRVGMTAIGLEKDSEVWPTARAVHFDGETFRLLQGLGLAEEFSAVTKPMETFEIWNEADEVLLSLPTGQLGPQGWHDSNTFHQPDIERLLRSLVAESESVELRTGVEALAVRNLEGGGVEVTCRTEDGTEQVLSSRWAIGADGAKSTVRRQLGLESVRFGDDADWLVVDGLLEGVDGYEPDMIFLGRHSRPALWVRLPGSRVRMEFMLMPGDDRDEIVTSEAIERVSRGILPVGNFEPTRQAIYNFRGRIVDQWRIGDVFLAGDAAHLAPPLFGQGLCAGMRDVANLVWKLNFVRLGLADEALLESYESERRPHAQNWVEQAVQAAGFVQTTDPEVAAQRDAFIRANPAAAAPQIPGLGPGLHSGSAGGGGVLSVQPVLANGTRLDDEIGSKFLIAGTDKLLEALPPDLVEAVDRHPYVVTRSDEQKTGPLLAASGHSAVVVRPDRYLLGAADGAGDLASLIQLIPGIG